MSFVRLGRAALVAGVLCAGIAGAARADINFSPALGLAIDAERALNAGDFIRSIDLAERALDSKDLTPVTASYVLNNLCVAYAQIERFDDAIAQCEKALRMDPRDWRFLNNRANAYMGLGLVDKAIDDYATALAHRPNSRILNDNLDVARRHKALGGVKVYYRQRKT